jgi:hypothetical protein
MKLNKSTLSLGFLVMFLIVVLAWALSSQQEHKRFKRDGKKRVKDKKRKGKDKKRKGKTDDDSREVSIMPVGEPVIHDDDSREVSIMPVGERVIHDNVSREVSIMPVLSERIKLKGGTLMTDDELYDSRWSRPQSTVWEMPNKGTRKSA